MPKGHQKDDVKTIPGSVSDSTKNVRDVSYALSILDSQHVKTAPFGANISGEQSYKRAERITAALHLITNHVPESEPLRALTREKALLLLSLILDVRSGFRSPSSEKGQAVIALIRELISLVRLLAIAGFVSTQNAGALSEALDELGSLIVVSERSTLGEQISISREELTPPTQHTSPDFKAIRREKDKKDTVLNVRTNERAGRIMDILKFGGELSIKDISAQLPQYSEKMVQRELLELVSLGSVLKIGEKRWSKYRSVQ